MRKTKIVCTLGPSSQNEEVIKSLIHAGMNVARINFSHGTYEEKQEVIDNLKKLRSKLNIPIPLLIDIRGPRVRLGKFSTESIELTPGQKFTVTIRDIIGDSNNVSISYKNLLKDIKVGTKLLIDEGLLELVVKETTETDAICEVISGGTLSSQKGVNFQGANINIPAITEKDIDDIKFSIKNDFDIIAASFVRKAEDIIELRKVLNEYGGSDMMIIAKIEDQQGVDNIDSIIDVADGIMVARGDLGVNIPIENVPIVQKMLIKKCNKAGKLVITATQMLDSMIRNPRPTRAEATDIANAIYDGTSAIMLSGETAMGKYPVDSVLEMSKIARRADRAIDYKQNFLMKLFELPINVTNAIGRATVLTAHDLKASAIITLTSSGNSAKAISKFKPTCKIIAVALSEKVQRQLNLSWGVIPLLTENKKYSVANFEEVIKTATTNKQVKSGDLVLITGSIPAGIQGNTNTLKVHVV